MLVHFPDTQNLTLVMYGERQGCDAGLWVWVCGWGLHELGLLSVLFTWCVGSFPTSLGPTISTPLVPSCGRKLT